MPVCKDCMNFTAVSVDTRECQINGPTFPDRDSERCPAKTFRPRIEQPKKIIGRKGLTRKSNPAKGISIGRI